MSLLPPVLEMICSQSASELININSIRSADDTEAERSRSLGNDDCVGDDVAGTKATEKFWERGTPSWPTNLL